MKFIILVSLFLLAIDSFSQEEIECRDLGCSLTGTLGVQKQVEFIEHSLLEVTNTDTEIDIITPDNSNPRNLRLYLQNVNASDVNVNYNSTKSGKDAGEVILISNNIENLSFHSNGYDGKSFNPASQACSEKILNYDYGSSIRTAYLDRRILNTEIPPNNCVKDDLLDIQNRDHTCATGYTPTTGDITSKRWIGKRYCKGETARKMCIRKKQKIKCVWPASKISSCCDTEPSPPSSVGWTCDISRCNATDNGWYKEYSYIDWADNVTQDIFNFGSETGLCANYFPRTSDNHVEELVENHWKGSFSGLWRYENMDFSYSTSGMRIYKIEWSPGAAVTCTMSGSCLNDEGLFGFNTWTTLTSSYNWRPWTTSEGRMDIYHHFLGCKLDSGFNGLITCDLSNQSSLSVAPEMIKESGFGYGFKIHYLNSDGQKTIRFFKLAFGHY